jgi:hypothetical protein
MKMNDLGVVLEKILNYDNLVPSLTAFVVLVVTVLIYFGIKYRARNKKLKKGNR